jgi:uncharacterized membrane protein/nitrite reductase/ring-hydroxylating ferredoxin subunit
MSEPSRPALRVLHDWLEGRPLGHPLHPMLVHLPIGLFVLSFLFDVASQIFAGEAWLVPAAFYSLVLALAAAVLAALTGVADWADIRSDHPGKPVATTHMALNLVAVALFGVSAILRLGQLDAAATPILPLLLSLVGLGLLSYSGYLGGRLIYEDGIAVGRHRRRGDLPFRTVQVQAEPEQDGFVPVAYTSRLAEGQTLRIEANGYVLALARIDGEFYAFQEFCTHRFGPLSEGALADGQVQCPWHRSCFDVRTGKVTQGPAKVDLKTFDVRVMDDIVLVRVPAEPPAARQEEQRQMQTRQ